ncbi:MAG: molybdate transport system substrate-binding protein [Actinomycetota bacterium]|nr:molybdate transport system substrate-binding protein [Actinomycetota bacterium]
MHRTTRIVAVLALTTSVLAGCGGSSGGSRATKPTSSLSPSADKLAGTVNVFAAASLQEAFKALGKQFQAAHPRTKLVFNFGPSSGLATQISQGAPADVFASASAKNMDSVVKARAATDATPFVKNVLEIAVPPANPGRITALDDLARSGVKVAVCQAQVPCGAVAAKVFRNAKITVRPATQEVDVKAVLAKVKLGEVDAGLVYVTDVLGAGAKVTGIPIPADVNASTSYPIATLTKAPNKAVAQAFTDYVLSAEGSAVLTAAGFQKP